MKNKSIQRITRCNRTCTTTKPRATDNEYRGKAVTMESLPLRIRTISMGRLQRTIMLDNFTRSAWSVVCFHEHSQIGTFEFAHYPRRHDMQAKRAHAHAPTIFGVCCVNHMSSTLMCRCGALWRLSGLLLPHNGEPERSERRTGGSCCCHFFLLAQFCSTHFFHDIILRLVSLLFSRFCIQWGIYLLQSRA